MSHKATAWAYAQTVTPSGAKFVLVALADFADEANSCYPGQTRIAAMTGQSVDSVARHLKALEEDGYLTRHRRSTEFGHRTSDRYVLHLADGPVRGGEPVEEPGSPEGSGQPDAPSGEGLPGKMTGRDSQTAPTPQSAVSAYPADCGSLPGILPLPNPQSAGGTVREPQENRKGGRSASRRRPATTIPEDWKPTTAHEVYATEHGLELSSESMKFRTHAAATDRRLVSWDAGFSMWLLKAKEMGPRWSSPTGRPAARAVGDRRPEGW